MKKIHFIGIGGIGISAIARLLKAEGKYVSGSDIQNSSICDDLKKYGVKIFIGHSENNIEKGTDLVIYNLAISNNNVELKNAKKIGIIIINYPQALGLFFNNKNGIAVCGTHGKSTTTAMVGLLLDDAEFDPSIVVGSIVPRYNSNFKVGKSQYFVAEACEYRRSFLNLKPKIIILNNIELDHTDCYINLDDLENAFNEFIENLSDDGILICNGNDTNIKNLISKIKLSHPELKIICFGQSDENDLRIYDISLEAGISKYKALYLGKDLGEFSIRVPGLFNIYNSLAAISLGIVLNIPIETIQGSLANFSGIWRRFEIKGNYKKSLVISDYAHHPTAVKATIEAAKIFYPDRRIFAVFQPHQYDRVKKLYNSFLDCFSNADIVIINEIFSVVGREKDQNLSSFQIVEDIIKKESNLVDKVFYAKDLDHVRKIIDEKVQEEDILLFMTAGNMYKIADEITTK
ncbi:UDP-N-acetylmuramate--L-alanine ligase [Methanosarcina sp. Ant1]|nr:UDP-N-acetylmuramate--L-alanine ligase [Methanosarcina sp. Ant1]